MDVKKIEEDLDRLVKNCIQVVNVEELKVKLIRYYREGKPIKAKLGLDPTAPDIHLGHTIVLRKLRDFQYMGDEVILIIGDFTGLIGDPSGRNVTRKPLSRDEIEKNAETYRQQIFKILDPAKTRVEYNSTWLRELGSDGFIRLCSRFTVSQILQRDDFSTRLKENKPISVHELIYPIAQAYDSVMIEADVELGGTDQTFNLLLGRELQREYQQEPQICMTLPILEGLDGVEKMSKSLGNYIGVTESPKEIFGKVMSISDQLMFRYYALLTGVPDTELETWKSMISDNKLNPMELKTRLARTLIEQFYDAAEAEQAEIEFKHIFSERKLPEEMPVSFYNCEDQKIWIIKLIMQEGMVSSQSEVRRLIKQGGVYYKIISDFENVPAELPQSEMERVPDANFEVDACAPMALILKVGKKSFRLIKFINQPYPA
ncbi:MAG: tyrosine--tRNA ligase [Candidatus Fischerbacteria bacterium RBG_13_37_8]|uniref:Tyrosine--tRNA ligase n=1 Tax=Candidatus Fischerbacteria bacterium RBG_13_37_8 TaxID=1817863 RepID=A0A1F5V5G7_9BACT|nr:MAG: tyrosine--tRNA ligase [Candidatus Fischerbacteria bacterium RBG_13_37_8]